MGAVYRARDVRLGRTVALKCVRSKTPGAVGSGPTPGVTPCAAADLARARIIREARAASALNLPHVCTVYDVGEAAGEDRHGVRGRPAVVRAGGSSVPDSLRTVTERLLRRDPPAAFAPPPKSGRCWRRFRTTGASSQSRRRLTRHSRPVVPSRARQRPLHSGAWLCLLALSWQSVPCSSSGSLSVRDETSPWWFRIISSSRRSPESTARRAFLRMARCWRSSPRIRAACRRRG
jgi:serine/threonine protein kinase